LNVVVRQNIYSNLKYDMADNNAHTLVLKGQY